MSQLGKENIIGIDDPGTPIYRLYSPKYFRKVLNDRRLTLVKPTLWEDPFENALLRCRIRFPDGKNISLAPLRERLYAQCWTVCVESDDLWRIYSPKMEGIKVESTVRCISRTLYKRNHKAASRYFLGRVRYHSEQELRTWLGSPDGAQSLLFKPKKRGYAESLLVKREAFSHEQEVRMIYVEEELGRAKRKEFHQVRVEPNQFFKSVTLDPRLETKVYRQQEQKIRDWGYMGPIGQSLLYNFNTPIIKVKNSERK